MHAALSAVSLAALAGLAVAIPTDKAARLVPCSYDPYTPPDIFHLDFFLANGTGEVPIEFQAGVNDHAGFIRNIGHTRALFSYDASLLRLSTNTTNDSSNTTWFSAPLKVADPIPFYFDRPQVPGQLYMRKGSEGCPSEDVYLYDREGTVDFSRKSPLAVWSVCRIGGGQPEQGLFFYAGPKGDALGKDCYAGTIRVRRLGI